MVDPLIDRQGLTDMSAAHTRDLLRAWVLGYISRLKGVKSSYPRNGTKNPFLELVSTRRGTQKYKNFAWVLRASSSTAGLAECPHYTQ